MAMQGRGLGGLVASSLASGWVLAAVVSLASGCGGDSAPTAAGAGDEANVPAQGEPEPGDSAEPALDTPVQGEPGDDEPAANESAANEPPPETESAPPTLDASKLALQQRPEGVRLVGSAGAVLPGDRDITVANADTGELVNASVAADGSLVLFAPGDRKADFFIDVDGDGVSDGRIPSLVDAAFAVDGACNCGTAFVSYIDGVDEDNVWGTPAMPLGCYSSEFIQGLNLDGYSATSCAVADASMLRVSGCGLTTVFTDRGDYTGMSFTFDDPSGELRGLTRHSDTPWGSCAVGKGGGWYAFDYIYGDYLPSPEWANELTVPCASTTTCRLCGSADDGIPACD